MPKRFRLYFRFDRDLLHKLPKLAWETVLEVYRAVLDRNDVVPGMVAGIQTHGQLSNSTKGGSPRTSLTRCAPGGTQDSQSTRA